MFAIFVFSVRVCHIPTIPYPRFSPPHAPQLVDTHVREGACACYPQSPSSRLRFVESPWPRLIIL